MKLTIVILNYKTPDLVIDCLESLQNQVNPEAHKVVVVDNNSQDDSAVIIQDKINEANWSKWVIFLPSPVNGGFSAGNNLGIKSEKSEYYLLLNSDIIVCDNAIEKMLKAIEEKPDVGIVSPRLQYSDGVAQISCFKYKSPISEFIDAARTGILTNLLKTYNVPINVSNETTYPQWTSFACVLIRGDVFRDVGLMDEGYFMYFEDIDFCRRTNNAGWKIMNTPHAKIIHLRGGSSSVKSSMTENKKVPAYYYKSRSRYFKKFYGLSGFYLANLLWHSGRVISFCREVIERKRTHVAKDMFKDIWINSKEPLSNKNGTSHE